LTYKLLVCNFAGRVIRMPWKAGPIEPGPETVVVSATRFLYRRRRYMPIVGQHGWRLRRAWACRAGSIGLFTGAEMRRPVTYSLSVWRDREDLRAFLRAPEHAKLIRDFRDRLEDSTSAVWEMDDFSPEAAWREGLRRLADGSQPSAGDPATSPKRRSTSSTRSHEMSSR
jgi:hypothetical protein